jgi:glycerol-3-phosphate dehydrogenase
MSKREAILEVIRHNPDVSVLIVGGGINGIGLLRDLALQGVDALLVEKGDFCGGTSAASTRIIHGGLRYLENAEFRLVQESLTERNRLLRNAAHYVKPLPITIPVFNWMGGMIHATKQFLGFKSKPGGRGALIFKAGLAMYDFLTRHDRAMPAHQFASRVQALTKRSHLNPDIVCTATYYDASIAYPERLCLELVLDSEAVSANDRALNYVRLESAAGNTVTLRDEISGEAVEVRPKVVINATGAWIDFTNQAMKRPSEFIGGTKGSHLVIDHPELLAQTQGQMLYFENTDGRICIFYQYYDKVIAGSTDLPEKDPDNAYCDDDETDYILESVRLVFPNIKIDHSQIVFKFCGVRPLPRSNTVTTGQISRDHSFPRTEPGNGIDFPIYSLIGGKWTTFRAFAEQVTDELLHRFNMTRKARTENMAIGGGKGYPHSEAEKTRWLNELSRKTGLSLERVTDLLEHYGTRAVEVAEYITAEPDEPLRNHPGYSRREILFLIEREYALHVDDIILRRTLMAMLGQLNAGLIQELAEILGRQFGWTSEQVQQEVERTLAILEKHFGVSGEQLGVTSELVS